MSRSRGVVRTGRRLFAASVVAGLAVVASTVTSAPLVGTANAGTAGGASWTVYVTNWNDNSVSPVDAATHAAGSEIVVSLSPDAVAFTPDATEAFVVNFGNSSVTQIDVATNTAHPKIDLGFPSVIPTNLAITPDGRTVLVVANEVSGGVVVPIDVATGALGTFIPVGGQLSAIAITPDGSTAFVTDNGGGKVVPIDLATMTAGTAIPVDANPDFPVVTPDGATLFISNSSAHEVTPIDVATRTAGTPIPAGSFPGALAVTPDGATLLVANGAPDNTVTPLTIATGTLGTPIPVSDNPSAIAITPDGEQAFVGNFTVDSAQTTIQPIDLQTLTAGALITVGSNPVALAITPDQAPVAHVSATSAPAGAATAFDASGSTVRYGAIASYAWDFGDGSPVVTTSTPTVTHTYAIAGSYAATVTETSSGGTSTTTVFTGQTMSRNGGPSAIAGATIPIATPVTPRFTG